MGALSRLRKFSGSPVLAEPIRLEALLASAQAAERIRGGHLAFTGGQLPAPSRPFELVGNTALIPVRGLLMEEPDVFDRVLFGATAYADIGAAMRAALADGSVERLVFDINSPGGEASGSFALSEEIHKARGQKPMVALANSMATSAAYMIASSADEVFMTRAAEVGSVGVVMAHVDVSEAEKAAGVKVTLLHQGARKVDGHPHAPLGEEARSNLMGSVATLFDMFVDVVAENRSMDPASVRAQESRVFVGPQAEGTNLIDGVRTLSEVLTPEASTVQTSRSETMAEKTSAPEMTVELLKERHPGLVEAVAAEAVKAERERVTTINAKAVGRPELAKLAEKARLEGWSLSDFAIGALDVKPDPGAEYLAAANRDADFDVGDGVPADGSSTALAALEHLSPEARAKAEWESDKIALLSEWDFGDGEDAAYERYKAIRVEELRAA